MLNPGKRVFTLVVLGLLAVPLSFAAIAAACTALATIASNPGAAAVGATVTVTGQGFSPHDPSDARTEPAMVRFDSLNGPVVGTASPSSAAAGGKFSVQITVPQLAVGDHVLVVTQNGTDGRPAFGTPARQAFAVTAPPAPPPAAAPPPPAAPPAPPAAPATAAVVEVPVLSQPFMTPAPPSAETLLRRAITRCQQRHNPAKAKTRVGKRRVTSRRAACITSARNRLA